MQAAQETALAPLLHLPPNRELRRTNKASVCIYIYRYMKSIYRYLFKDMRYVCIHVLMCLRYLFICTYIDSLNSSMLICMSFIHMCAKKYMCMCIWYLPVCMRVCLSAYLPNYLSTRLPIYLSICLFICLSTYLALGGRCVRHLGLCTGKHKAEAQENYG